MARFASEAELETFLGRLDPDYSQFASALWQKGVRTARQLANATKPLLLSYGLPELYVDDIKATADRTGEPSALTYAHCACQSKVLRTPLLSHVVCIRRLGPQAAISQSWSAHLAFTEIQPTYSS